MKQALSVYATSQKNVKLGFKIHLIAFLLLTPAIWIVWLLTDTTYPWPLWSTPAWAVGVLFHYLGVFVFKKSGLKKSLLIWTMLFVGAGSSFANKPERINEQVISSFKRDFTTAQDVSWDQTQATFKATFKLNDQVMFAWYTEDGNLLAVVRNMVSGQLPISLLSDLKNNYSGYWISDLFEMVSNDATSYYITIEDSEQKIVLRSQGGVGWETFRKERK
jgi:hypothetical protein